MKKGKSAKRSRPVNPPQSNRIPAWLWPVLALGITFLTLSPTLQNGITNWDDPAYISQNPFIKSLTIESVGAMFNPQNPVAGNYHPLTLLTYAVEYRIAGETPFTFHFTNLLLHLLNTLLVFCLIRALSGKQALSFLVALLFGIHPMHVESVAWISERKDLLYGGFYIASLWAYVRFVDTKNNRLLLFAFLFFVAGLLSKAMAVTVPVVFFAIDYYRKRPFAPRLLWEKLPFLALSILFGIIALKAQGDATAFQSGVEYSLLERIPVAAYGLSMYLAKFFVPFHLSCFYPYPFIPGDPLPTYLWVAFALMLSLLIGAGFILINKKESSGFRDGVFGLSFFLISISLVIQILPVGNAIIADRYTYLPYIGLFFMLGKLISGLIGKYPKYRLAVMGLVGVWIVVLAVAAFQRSRVWHDDLSLWNDAIAKYPEAAVSLNNRGLAYAVSGQLNEAFDDYSRAIEVQPDYQPPYLNRGVLYFDAGQLEEALADYDEAIRLNPSHGPSYSSRGALFGRMGQAVRAMQDLDKAIELAPNLADAYRNRGVLAGDLKQYDLGVQDFTRYLKLKPGDDIVLSSRGFYYQRMGRTEEAIRDFTEAISLDPQNPVHYLNRAISYRYLNQVERSIADARIAQQLGLQVDSALLK